MPIPDFKICPRCQINKHKTEYHTRNDRGYTYLKSYCKQCSKNTYNPIYQSDKCNCGNNKTKGCPTCKACTRMPHSKLFVENSQTRRHVVKRTIIRDNLLPYCCSVCGLLDSWNNKPLTLHLDHINGINNDNRLENLRFLCPNCHSQTPNYCTKLPE